MLKRAILALFFCAIFTGVRAQTTVSYPNVTALEQATASQKDSAVSGGPTGGTNTGLALSLPTLQFSYINGKGEFSGAYNHALPLSWFGEIDGGGIAPTQGFVGLKLAIPIPNNGSNSTNTAAASGSGLNTLAASNQLPNGFKLSAPFSLVNFSPLNFSDVLATSSAHNALVPLCDADNAQKLATYETALLKPVNGQTPILPQGVKVASGSTDCPMASTDQLIGAYGAPDGGLGTGGFWQLTITPALQYLSENYYAPSTLAPKSTKHVLPSVDIAVSNGISYPFGLSVPGKDYQPTWLIWTPDFNYGATEKDKASKTECLNKVSASVLSCINGSVGSPKSGKTEAASLAIKIDFDTDIPALGTNVTNVMLIPKYTYDAAVGQTGLDLPIYLLLKSSSSVFPGIDMNWTSVKHQFVIGAFLASSFGS